MRKRMKNIVFILVAVLIGCTAPSQYGQIISGNLLSHGNPVSDIPVRFSLGEKESTPCQSYKMETMTNHEGYFRMIVPYYPSISEKYAVSIHKHSICLKIDNVWREVWSLKTGPALNEITLNCNYIDKENIACK